jgi:hypothetical protein
MNSQNTDKIKVFEISENVLNATLEYLSMRPYREVHILMAELIRTKNSMAKNSGN